METETALTKSYVRNWLEQMQVTVAVFREQSKLKTRVLNLDIEIHPAI